MERCPFKAGDIVVYKPSVRGRGLVIMTDLANLVPGEKYKVARIEGENSVVIEGFEDTPGGGLYWTEFTSTCTDAVDGLRREPPGLLGRK